MPELTPAEGLPDVLIVDFPVFADERGFFTELWHAGKYADAGLDALFVQDNLSHSRHGVLRGLHYQWPGPQGKLVQIIAGTIFDVAVDIRRGSPTFGRWFGIELDARRRRHLYVPEGFAHGFCVLSSEATVLYKCTRVYDPAGDAAIAWNDPDIGIDWPIAAPLLSPKDAAAPRLASVPTARLPVADGAHG
jgi:dTDP-4-dehydrorhamnose 3,5-epimerase